MNGPVVRQVLDCGGKRSATPLSNGDNFSNGLSLTVSKSDVTATALQGAGTTKQTPFSSWTRLSVLTLFSILLAGCGVKHGNVQGEASNLPAVPVQVQTITNQQHTSTESVVGTVQARLHATLEAKVSGHIAQMPVTLGQSVKAGQLLVLLDSNDLKARLDQAKAASQQAKRDWDRISALFHQQAATQSEYDSAEARKNGANAAVAEAKAMLAYAKVVAPFDGVVTRKWADVGDLASPGKPLVDIEDPSQLQVWADVPDNLTPEIHLDEKLGVRVDGINNELAGTVAEISPAADPMTHTFRVKVNLPATPGLKSGQFARVEVPAGESRTLFVPDSAVVQRGELEILFVVADGHAQLRLVKTGRHIGKRVEILSGLNAGETVVIQGVSQLADGQPVEVK